MKTVIIVITIILLALPKVVAQSKYSSAKGFVSFFSKAPIADVDAKNGKVNVELNASDGAVIFDITMKDFKFKSEKMGRDARKKYLETDKYSKAGFKGKFQGNIDYDKPGSYAVTATGKLNIHGVEKNVSEKGTVIVEKEGVKLQSEFHVALADYNIQTPQILGKEMTEDKVLVKIEAKLMRKTKDTSKKK